MVTGAFIFKQYFTIYLHEIAGIFLIFDCGNLTKPISFFTDELLFFPQHFRLIP